MDANAGDHSLDLSVRISNTRVPHAGAGRCAGSAYNITNVSYQADDSFEVGGLTIRVHQPDGSTLGKIIEITEQPADPGYEKW